MPLDVRGLAPLLQVYDMPTSIQFYRDLLGFELVNHAPEYAPGRFHWALLRLNGVEFMLNTVYEFDDERPPVREPARVAAHEDTCLYFGCPDVDAAYRHLREKGIEAKEPLVAPYGMKQLYLRDPDGFALCFQWPTR
jgi:glyoxylase I family protein